MLAIVDAREPRRGARALRAVGDPRDGGRARHRHRPLPRVRRPVRRGRRARREPARRRAATTPPDGVVGPRARRRRPVGSLGDGPVYDRPLARARRSATRCTADDPAPMLARAVPRRHRPRRASCSRCSRTPTIADKSWVWRQYDHQLFLNTVVGPGGDAAVLRLKGTPQALALATDGKARFCALDPRTGARLVVLEAARNVACAGAEPAGAGELPQLRQPGAPRGDVAVLRGRRRHERGVRARSASPSSAAT